MKIQMLVKPGTNFDLIGLSFRIGKKYPEVLFCYEYLQFLGSYVIIGNVEVDRFKKMFGKIDFRNRSGQFLKNDIRLKIFDVEDSKLVCDIIYSRLKFGILTRVVENVEDSDRAYKIVTVTKFFINFEKALVSNVCEQWTLD